MSKTTTETLNAIEMKNITKIFGNFKANDDINITLKKGEILALLGENGAGKSTLMNILSGLLQPTSGQILLNGKLTNIDSPATASKLGIGMVHQHFMLIDDFTVEENISLGYENTKHFFLDKNKTEQEIKQISEQYGLGIDLKQKVADITVGMQQRVEILKVLYRGADILILDEPTAVLTPQEIDELIEIMHGLTKEGKSIILITHKLDEIRKIADRVTVIRRGKTIDTFSTKGVSNKELAQLMVGREVSFKTKKPESLPTKTVLSIRNLIVENKQGIQSVNDVDLDVLAGEVVGIAGIDGNGQSELIQAILGLTKIKSGTIEILDNDVTNKNVKDIIQQAGNIVGQVPEDRQKEGLVLDMNIAENIILKTYNRYPNSSKGILNYKNINSHARDLITEFDIRTTNEQNKVKSLSGGNQQKVIIAREIDQNPELLIISNPTRGLDVGAIEYIHQRIIEQRTSGKAVLLVSFELDEIMNLSDRIAVMHAGKIQGIVNAKSTNEEQLGLLMAGVSNGGENE
ncbi:MAG: ABC transporter ATP-binding protein [Lactobacillaceae bacterium]|jgi:simple sugar transport system ATP-binding protein|nr:ABC transporter ATP-binding protein [Lactobacillaceae bacterium]